MKINSYMSLIGHYVKTTSKNPYQVMHLKEMNTVVQSRQLFDFYTTFQCLFILKQNSLKYDYPYAIFC